MPMKLRKRRKRANHSGSAFDSFLQQEGFHEEVGATALRRVLSWRREQTVNRVPKQGLSGRSGRLELRSHQKRQASLFHPQKSCAPGMYSACRRGLSCWPLDGTGG